MTDQFYVILPSDSSMSHYPDNTAAQYTTLLPHEINLSRDWSVALTEIQYPSSFQHMRDAEDSIIEYATSNKDAKYDYARFYAKRGVYTNLQDLFVSFTESMEDYFSFKCDASGIVKIEFLRKDDPQKGDYFIRMSKKMANICGLNVGTSIPYSSTPQQLPHHLPRPSFVDPNKLLSFKFPDDKIIESLYPASLSRGIPDKMFIYSDICEHYVTGDVKTSLLRIVPANAENYVYGTTRTVHFGSANYIPLLHTSFRTIEIDIRDAHGEPIPFEYGPLNITLHFKRTA